MAHACGGKVTGRNSFQCPAPGHRPKDDSIHVTIDPSAPDGFVAHCFSPTMTGLDAKRWVMERNDMVRDRSRPFAPRAAPRAREEDEAAIARRIEDGRKIWGDSDDPRDTLVTTYLHDHRFLELPDTIANTVIRFDPHHTKLFYPETHPVMVARMRNVRTLETIGVHVTRLRSKDASKIKPPKMKGPTGSGAVMFGQPVNHDGVLTIAEGVETALTALLHPDAIAKGFLSGAVWALGNAGSIGRVPILPGITVLQILAENDSNGTNEREIKNCLKRWESSGAEVTQFTPDPPHNDFTVDFKRSNIDWKRSMEP
jgi:hypothetical protein